MAKGMHNSVHTPAAICCPLCKRIVAAHSKKSPQTKLIFI